MIDIKEKKRKIIEFLKISGPSLPVQVARAIQMEPMFASAILSELLGTREIKTSYLRVGSSPLYLIPGQEEKLEERTDNLKSIEREACEKLKLKKILMDENEDPAIRVALRNIRDFAIPFKFQAKIAWRYTFTPQEEINELLSPKPKEDIKLIQKKIEPEESTKERVPKKTHKTKKSEIKIAKEKSKSQTTFLEEVGQFLETQNTIITAIEEVDKKKITAIVKSEETISMLFAFNKTRISETEILKCYKTSEKKNIPYQIIIRGELTKKLSDTISAHQKLLGINKLEN